MICGFLTINILVISNQNHSNLTSQEALMFDILIKNGTIIDGTGNKREKADIGILKDRIVEIGNLSESQSQNTIDANGLTVSPGFIDMHSHGDMNLAFLPTADSKIHQGITLEVVGNCGMSMAPLSKDMVSNFNSEYRTAGGEHEVTWDSFGGYIKNLQEQGISLNIAPLVGHGTIREKVMGMSDALPDQNQLAAMEFEVDRAMDEGAFGLSTGLIYTPNTYSKTDEIISLAKRAAKKGGIYASHVRDEGKYLIESIEEAFLIGRSAELPVEISHLKAAGPYNWHKMAIALEMINDARIKGMDVASDMYPYPKSNTNLNTAIPAWVHVGGTDKMISRLKDPAMRAQIHKEVGDPVDSNEVGWDGVMICSCPLLPALEGRMVQDIADEWKRDPLDTTMDILIESNNNAEVIKSTMKEENVTMGLSTPFIMIGSDGGELSIEGFFAAGKPHPRNYGTFPRVLAKYARQEKLFTLEEAVRKMTGLSAERLKLHQRGLLKQGYFADITIFDADHVLDKSTFIKPQQYPEGIQWVIVNGKIVIADSIHTGSRPGKIISIN
jgi:N-acyl-D-amino-acid deacylase